MRVRKVMSSFWDIRLLGIRVPLLVAGLVVLFGGIFGLAKISETAAMLVAGLAIIVILLSFSGSISSWRRAGKRSSVHPHQQLWTPEEQRAVTQAQLEADRVQEITTVGPR